MFYKRVIIRIGQKIAESAQIAQTRLKLIFGYYILIIAITIIHSRMEYGFEFFESYY